MAGSVSTFSTITLALPIHCAARSDQAVRLFTQMDNAGLWPFTRFGGYFQRSIYLVAAVTAGYAFWMLLRPLLLRRPLSTAKRGRAYALIAEHGRDVLAHFALFPDKRYWFSPGGSLVAYAVRRQVAVALGDPIGPLPDASAAIVGFQGFCQRQRLHPTFYQTTPAYLPLYQEAGLSVLAIGAEGIVDLATFDLNQPAHQPLLATIDRLRQHGYRTGLYTPPLSDRLLAELHSVSDEWLLAMQGRERSFDRGWFDQDYIGNSPVFTVQSPEGAVVAFANPIAVEHATVDHATVDHADEITVDLLRWRADVDTDVIDFLLISLLHWAKEEGYDTFNLGLSPLSGVDVQPDDPTASAALAYVIEHVGQFYGFRGIHEFKEQFCPAWRPRYLVFPGLAHLAAVGDALESVGSGDNFIFDSAAGLLYRQRAIFAHRQVAAQARGQSALALRQIPSDEGTAPSSHPIP